MWLFIFIFVICISNECWRQGFVCMLYWYKFAFAFFVCILRFNEDYKWSCHFHYTLSFLSHTRYLLTFHMLYTCMSVSIVLVLHSEISWLTRQLLDIFCSYVLLSVLTFVAFCLSFNQNFSNHTFLSFHAHFNHLLSTASHRWYRYMLGWNRKLDWGYIQIKRHRLRFLLIIDIIK